MTFAVWERLCPALYAAIAEFHVDAWLVGGAVRDLVLGLPVRDVDIAIAGATRAVAEALGARLAAPVIPLRHGTWRIALPDGDGAYLDLTPLRGATLASDLAARDFRINAMAIPLTEATTWARLIEHIFDPLGGQVDLAAHRLSLASPIAFRDDPGRILRGARFIAAYDLTPADETLEQARESASALRNTAADRLRDEVTLLLAGARPASGIAWLHEAQALGALFPECATLTPDTLATRTQVLRTCLDAVEPLYPKRQAIIDYTGWLDDTDTRGWYQTRAAHGLTRLGVLRWALLAAVLLGVDGDLAGRTRRMAPAGAAWRSIRSVRLHVPAAGTLLRQEHIDLPATRLFFARMAGHEADALHCLLVAAAGAAPQGEEAPEMTARMRAHAADMVHRYLTDPSRYVPQPLLTGGDLAQTLPAVESAQIGVALRAVRLAQLEGTIATHADALALASAFTSTL